MCTLLHPTPPLLNFLNAFELISWIVFIDSIMLGHLAGVTVIAVVFRL